MLDFSGPCKSMIISYILYRGSCINNARGRENLPAGKNLHNHRLKRNGGVKDERVDKDIL